jgi:hypothetical protein
LLTASTRISTVSSLEKHFDANLCVFKIYFVSTTIAAADNGVGHEGGSPWLSPVLRERA